MLTICSMLGSFKGQVLRPAPTLSLVYALRLPGCRSLCKGGCLNVHTLLLQLSTQQRVVGIPRLACPDPLCGADLLAVLGSAVRKVKLVGS